MKIRPAGAELFHSDGQAGGQDATKTSVAVVFLLLGDSPASKFYVTTFRNILLVHTTYEVGTECSETSAYKIQTPRNHPQERIQHSRHGESLNSRLIVALRNFGKRLKINPSFLVPMYRLAYPMSHCNKNTVSTPAFASDRQLPVSIHSLPFKQLDYCLILPAVIY
jgi:hypothetical protein